MPGLLTGYDPRTTSSYAAISGVSDTGLNLIQNAQKEHPEYYKSGYRPAYFDFMDTVIDGLKDASIDDSDANNPPRVSYPSSAKSTTKKKKKSIDYTNAEIAKMYGMSRSTAYQEALANTSYQRSVKDMQAAGLNPAVLFGAGRASPASSAVYAADASSGSGGSGRSYGRSRRSSGNDDKLFSSGVYNALSTIGGLIGIATTKRPDGYWIGSQTTKGAMSAFDALAKLGRK